MPRRPRGDGRTHPAKAPRSRASLHSCQGPVWRAMKQRFLQGARQRYSHPAHGAYLALRQDVVVAQQVVDAEGEGRRPDPALEEGVDQIDRKVVPPALGEQARDPLEAARVAEAEAARGSPPRPCPGPRLRHVGTGTEAARSPRDADRRGSKAAAAPPLRGTPPRRPKCRRPSRSPRTEAPAAAQAPARECGRARCCESSPAARPRRSARAWLRSGLRTRSRTGRRRWPEPLRKHA